MRPYLLTQPASTTPTLMPEPICWGFARSSFQYHGVCLILKGMHYRNQSLDSLISVGSGLKRPECALAHQSGVLFTPNWAENGGISLILPDGSTYSVMQSTPDFSVRPNGIALDFHGNLVMAHLGERRGGVFTLKPNGSLTERVTTANHQPLPPSNFVVHDKQGRLWITVSTRVNPRADDYRRQACTGFIALAEPGETNARIVADGLGYTNELVVDESRQAVFVNETFARRLTRFDLLPNGSLSNPETLINFGHGIYPDGITLASDDSFWITSLLSNRVIVVDKNNEMQVLLEDFDEDNLNCAETAYENDALGREHLDNSHAKHLHNISNLAFAGNDLRTACLGNLLGTSIPTFRAPVAGSPMTHWEVPIDHWLDQIE